MENKFITYKQTNQDQNSSREKFYQTFRNCPIPQNEILSNLGLFINRQKLMRILFMHELYQKILNVNGVIMEFGVRWGQNLALFESFRGIYEPYNHNRKIIGFDTFDGFPSIHEKDGKADIAIEKAYSTTEGYEKYLEEILNYHESESPISHIKKFELIKGDATKTIYKYLDDNPQTIIAFAYFDFDIYEPTKECLLAIKERLTKGAIIGFDELNTKQFPGETIALMEVFGLNKYTIQRSPISSAQSFIVIQ